jgi:Fe-S cluster assembly protein SufD
MSNEQRVIDPTAEATPASPDVSASAALGKRLGDSPAVAKLRARAARAATTMEMPTPVQRPWKYLDVSLLKLDAYRPGLDAPQDAAAITPEGDGKYAGLLVQKNSETVLAQAGEPGLQIVDFAAANDSQRSLIDKHLGQAVPFDRSKFTALHYAFLRGGVLVNVEANAEIAHPVRIDRALLDAGQLATPHTLIVTGANSRVVVIEDFRSTGEDIAVIPVVEIVPGPGSEVRYTALHQWGRATRVFSEQRTVTQRDAAVVSLSLVTGGSVVKSHIESSLAGQGSSSELFGLFVGDDRQHVDFYTLQDHIGPNTRSDLLYKSAMTGSSRSVYYGLTRVGLGAKNADANQVDRNLLLSRTAKADSDPVLEILTNDVIRVSHGATAGPVDEEQLFYLQTRGLTHQAAEALLVRGFLNQVLDRVPDEALREELTIAIEAKLGALA